MADLGVTKPAPPPARLPPDPVQIYEVQKREDISILHPHAQKPNVLIQFPRVDFAAENNGTKIYGFSYRIALLACQIIGGNAFENSYLSVNQTGEPKISGHDDDDGAILTEATYYFFIEGYDAQNPYPVVPNFQSWSFPATLPHWWPVTTTGDHNRQSYCGITGSKFAIENAHLVPQEYREWYDMNSMSTSGEVNSVDSDSNLLDLRADMHTMFDNRHFVIVPRVVTVAGPGGATLKEQRFVTTLMMVSAPELYPDFHLVAVNGLKVKSSRKLFARFAWSVLMSVKPFVFSRPSRQIWVSENLSKEMSSSELHKAFGGSGTKASIPTRTPQKRSRVSTSLDDYESLDDEELGPMFWDSPQKRMRHMQMSTEETVPDDHKPDNLKPEVEGALRQAIREIITL